MHLLLGSSWTVKGVLAQNILEMDRRTKRQLAKKSFSAVGTINSPQILLLSGIGPSAHLQEMGLDVVMDLPGVGQNLQDHLAIVLTYYWQEARKLGCGRIDR